MNGRVPPLAREDIDPAAVAELRASFPRAEKFFADGPQAPPLPPVLGLLARHTAITGPWLAYSGALLERGVLDARTRELLILATAHRTRCSYLWQEHLHLAAAAGVPPDEVAALQDRSQHTWDEQDAALLQAVDELVSDQQVADDTWHALSEHLAEQELLEVLFVIGTYSCLAMVLNSTRLAYRGKT